MNKKTTIFLVASTILVSILIGGPLVIRANAQDSFEVFLPSVTTLVSGN